MAYSDMSIRELQQRLVEFKQNLADVHHALDAAPRGRSRGRHREQLANLEGEYLIVRNWLKIKRREPNGHHAH